MFGFFIFFFCTQLWAQDISSFFSPSHHVGQLSMENLIQPKVESESREETKMVNSRLDAQYNIKTEKFDYLIGANYRHLDFDNNIKINRDYYQYQGSLGVKKHLSNNRFWLTTLSYGTASDRPFKNANDDTISANFIKKTSDKWFFVLNYSNNRVFLNNIPFPGFFYVKEATREKMTIFGLPFFLFVRQYGDWSFKYLGFLPWTHQARVSFVKFFWIRPYLGFEQGVMNFFRHDREDLAHRVFFFQRKIGTGVEMFLTKHLKLDTFVGHSFDTEIFEARNFNDKKFNTIKFENSMFLETKLILSF